MRPDTNTNGYFQWFYFKVRCIRAKKVVRFTIRNFVKGSMLYHQGLLNIQIKRILIVKTSTENKYKFEKTILQKKAS